MKNQSSSRILLVEDTTQLWSSIQRGLKQTLPRAEVICRSSLEEANEYLVQNSVDLIICDFYLPNLRTGFELWEATVSKRPVVPFVLISGMSVEE